MADWMDYGQVQEGRFSLREAFEIQREYRERAVEFIQGNWRNIRITPVDREGRPMWDASVTFPEGTYTMRVDGPMLNEAGVEVEEIRTGEGLAEEISFGLREIQMPQPGEVLAHMEFNPATGELTPLIDFALASPPLQQQPRQGYDELMQSTNERLVTVKDGPDAGTTELWYGHKLIALTVDGIYYTRGDDWLYDSVNERAHEDRSYGYTQCRPLFELMPIDDYDELVIEGGWRQDTLDDHIMQVNKGEIEPALDCPWRSIGGHWGITPEWGIPRAQSMLDLSDAEVDSLPMSVLERYV